MKIFDMVPFDALIPIDKSSRATTIVVATIVVLKSRVFTNTILVLMSKVFVVVGFSHQKFYFSCDVQAEAMV